MRDEQRSNQIEEKGYFMDIEISHAQGGVRIRICQSACQYLIHVIAQYPAVVYLDV